MIRLLVSITVCIFLLTGVVSSQEVIVTGFPVGVGGSESPDIFKPYHAQLQSIADTLQKHKLTRAIITGGADGIRYRHDNDAKNAALALGRAHALRNVLVHQFHVDSTQIIIQSGDTEVQGARHRYAGVRIAWGLADLGTRLDSLANRPPVDRHVTEVKEITNSLAENMGLQLGAGLSSSPFGAIPIVSWAVTWGRTIYVEGVVGHTFWNSSFLFQQTDLDTKKRMAGGQVIVYPFDNMPVGFVGGWIRVEEISQQYYAHVRMSEGPVLGLRAVPFDFMSLTAVYNPASHHIAGESGNRTKSGQFLISITTHLLFGGGQ